MRYSAVAGGTQVIVENWRQEYNPSKKDVEKAHRTHTEEFHEVTGSSFDIAELRPELLQWECTYNTIRPHQALGCLTPLEFLKRRQQYRKKEVMCH